MIADLVQRSLPAIRGLGWAAVRSGARGPGVTGGVAWSREVETQPQMVKQQDRLNIDIGRPWKFDGNLWKSGSKD